MRYTNFDQHPIQYEIQVAGQIDPARVAWFEGITLKVQQTGEAISTILSVTAPDQSALFGILTRVRDLGIPLISITPQPKKDLDQEENDGTHPTP